MPTIRGELAVSVDSLSFIRERMLPMLEFAAEQYRSRVPRGYPNLVDNADQGVFGLEIDPSHALYVTTDGQDLFAEVYRRAPRTDNRNSAGREKFAGMPVSDRRPLSPDSSDQDLRNLIADLMSYFNMQPNLIYITDD
jgi:hypothetical protein